MRHSVLRYTEARMMEKVFKYVKVKPELLPAGPQTSGNNTEKARLCQQKVYWEYRRKRFLTLG